jgi:hypothetical protein
MKELLGQPEGLHPSPLVGESAPSLREGAGEGFGAPFNRPLIRARLAYQVLGAGAR